MAREVLINGSILGLMMTVVIFAQETAAIGFDPRNCWDCEGLTLEGAVSEMILAAGIGCAISIIRSVARRGKGYEYRGISLKLR
jgi:hypothetical protein